MFLFPRSMLYPNRPARWRNGLETEGHCCLHSETACAGSKSVFIIEYVRQHGCFRTFGSPTYHIIFYMLKMNSRNISLSWIRGKILFKIIKCVKSLISLVAIFFFFLYLLYYVSILFVSVLFIFKFLDLAELKC